MTEFFFQRLAFDEFEYERVSVTAVFETVDRGNVRMIERGQHLRLAPEACEAIAIERERVGDDLQRDVAIQLGIARAIHLAHPAGAESGDDLVGTETGAGNERQTDVDYTGATVWGADRSSVNGLVSRKPGWGPGPSRSENSGGVSSIAIRSISCSLTRTSMAKFL